MISKQLFKKLAIALALSLAIFATACSKSADNPEDIQPAETQIEDPSSETSDGDSSGIDANYVFLEADQALRAFLDAMSAKNYAEAQKCIWPFSETAGGYESGTYAENFAKIYDISGYDFLLLSDNNNVQTFQASLTVESSDGPYDAQYEFSVINDSTGFFVCADNIIACYKGAAPEKSEGVKAYLTQVDMLGNGYMVHIEVQNHSDKAVTVGSVEQDAIMTMVTDYESKVDEMQNVIDGSPYENFLMNAQIAPGESQTLSCEYLDAKGLIQGLTIQGISGQKSDSLDVTLVKLEPLAGGNTVDSPVNIS